MKLEPSSEVLIRRYLLAAVTEEEREQVEARLMIDDDFFQQINLVEDELVDEYLDEVLSPKDRRGFEETFLCAPERQHKLRFARALRAYAGKAARVGALEGKREKAPWWQPILTLLNPPRPVLAYSLGAAVLSIAVGGPWTLIRIAGLERRIEALQAQQQSREVHESVPRAQYDELMVKTNQISAQLRQEQEKWSTAQSAGGKGSSESRTPLISTLALVLTPGMTRGAQSSQTLQIDRGTSLIVLKLDLPENRHKTYKAVLLHNGQEVLSRNGLRASESADQVIVRLELAASDLTSGDYQIRLFGSGPTDVFEAYGFRVTRK